MFLPSVVPSHVKFVPSRVTAPMQIPQIQTTSSSSSGHSSTNNFNGSKATQTPQAFSFGALPAPTVKARAANKQRPCSVLASSHNISRRTIQLATSHPTTIILTNNPLLAGRLKPNTIRPPLCLPDNKGLTTVLTHVCTLACPSHRHGPPAWCWR